MSESPILYSFRRCPYAMRARMALMMSGQTVKLREVVLRDKPREMIEASSKATVPVLILEDGTVIDESLAIMNWALNKNDPEGWSKDRTVSETLVAEADGEFKTHLDRYKYPSRYDDVDPIEHRTVGLTILRSWDRRISGKGQLAGSSRVLADIAIFPFVRQFANYDRSWFDAQSIPALQKWLAGHLESDLFQSIMAKYPQWKAGDEESVLAQL
ncbi:MAG: glutathione S-transferase [Parasphingorhabdus sp.]